jgi:hypothetical protein
MQFRGSKPGGDVLGPNAEDREYLEKGLPQSGLGVNICIHPIKIKN